jgi:hypothetical protein
VIIDIIVVPMKTDLDNIPSTITLSLGLKNRIRKLKGSMTYEQFLAQLIRSRTTAAQSENSIELIEFERKSMTYSDFGFNILFDYNKLIDSASHIFDIRIKRILHKGKDVDMGDVLEVIKGTKNEPIERSYWLYFQLLFIAIREETKIPFNHKGRIEDYELWKQEFKNLGLSEKAYENDVKNKLIEYENGVQFSW